VSNARIQKTNFIISGLALVCNAQVARRQHAGNTQATRRQHACDKHW